MKTPNQALLIGGGYSITEGIQKGLWSKLKGRFTIGTNFSMYNFIPTIHAFVDQDFYQGLIKGYYQGDKIVANLNEKGKSHVEKLKSLPLIVGLKHSKLEKYDNTILFNNSSTYHRDIKKNGIYKSSLCGIWALSLAIYLLNEGTVFLIGFDYGCPNLEKDKFGKYITHYYQSNLELQHRGLGKISHYNTKDRAKRDYDPFRNEEKCKIFNVSLNSKIPETIFPKISYDQMFAMLDNNFFNQGELREEIKEKLNG